MSPTGTATATPTAPLSACVGDCNRNQRVTVDELVVGVNISLQRQNVEACVAFDPSNSGEVEVNELVQGVNNSLGGCPGT